MSERGMLFVDSLALAIHEGRKTVTRRPITKSNSRGFDAFPWDADFMVFGDEKRRQVILALHREGQRLTCRIETGDTLIVRECHAVIWDDVDGCACDYPGSWCPEHMQIEYRADTGFSAPAGWHLMPPDERMVNWTPSIHMNHDRARSRREIISVGAEVLAPLTDAEARMEGFASGPEFDAAWAKIYGDAPRQWVWRIEFAVSPPVMRGIMDRVMASE